MASGSRHLFHIFPESILFETIDSKDEENTVNEPYGVSFD
jgi:hypothetical protein